MLCSRSWRALMRRNFIYRKRNFVSTILEFTLPILFIFFLVLIKISVQDTDGFSPETVEATFPDGDEAFVTYSFTDYATAIQSKRVCLNTVVVDLDINIDDLRDLFDQGDFSNISSAAEAEQALAQLSENDNIQTRTRLAISGIPTDFSGRYNWQVPFVRCNSELCEEEGEEASGPYCEYLMLAVAPYNAGDTVGEAQAKAFREYIYTRYPQIAVNAPDFESSANNSLPFDFDFVRYFNSNDEIDDYVRDPNYATTERPAIALAVTFDGSDSSVNYNYHVRQNVTGYNAPEERGRPLVFTTPPTDKKFASLAKTDEDSCQLLDGASRLGNRDGSCTAQYAYNGILPLQRLIGDWIMVDSGAKDAGFFVSEHGVRYAPFPSKEYVENGFYASIAGFVPLLVTLGLLYPVSSMVRYIVREKELRQKELMKMMSVAESDINWAWFISFAALHFLTAIGSGLMTSALYSNSELPFLIIFWIFAWLAIIPFCMFLATFFSKATRATLVSLLVFFAGYFLTLITSYDDGNRGTISLISLHPVAAFSYGLQEIGRLEDLSIGLTSGTVDSTDSVSGYTFATTLNSFIIDAIVWGFFTWYLNRVLRSDYGQPLPWYFLCTRSYWCPRSAPPPSSGDDEAVVYEDSIPVEPVSDRLKEQAAEGKSIEVRKLRKVFEEKTAVDGLSMSLYRDQITALLGHNGAGKTTTINMLTGMFAPTDGYATISGKDIRTNMTGIREDLGICPQHDVLFPELTVKEHIQFFAAVKGMYAKMSGSEAEEKINQSIKDVALYEKRNTLSKNLSGGMKRKLHVAIAFCGDSKTVLLDEPTSGMDPFSRRFTWNVIRQYRQDRCIILTTHFMDEADILGDRIAIMAEGRLRCLGSSLFLKKTYGVGYQLTIEKVPKAASGNRGTTDALSPPEENTTGLQEALVLDDDTKEPAVEVGHQKQSAMMVAPGEGTENIDQALKDIVLGAVPDATLLSNVGTEMSFQLPLSKSHAFTPMFEQLDDFVDRRLIVTYGVGITTLDEVFLLVARGASAEKDKAEFASSRRPGGSKGAMMDDVDKSARSRMNLEDDGLFSRHLVALFRKRALNFKRDKKAWVCTTILPTLFVLVGLILFTVGGPVRDLDSVVLDFDDYNEDVGVNPRNPVLFNAPGSSYTCQPGNCLGDPFINVNATGETYYACGFQSYLGNSACGIQESENIMQEFTTAGASAFGDSSTNVLESSFAISNSSSDYKASQYGGVYFTHDASSVANTTGFNFGQSSAFLCSSNPGDYLDPTECQNYAGGIGYVIRYNYTALHVSPLFLTLADEAIVKHAIGQDDFKIKATIDPLPLTDRENRFGQSQDAFTAWFLLVLSWPFISGSFGTFVVAERQSKAKHLQTVAGVKPFAYWLSTWLWDIANYQIPLWITVALFFAFDVEVFTTSEKGTLGGVLCLLFLYGPASASFTYCISFLFTSPSICNLFVIISGFLLGFGGSLAAFIMRLIGENPSDPNQGLVTAADTVEWVLRFVPSFSLAKGLFNTINIGTFEFLAGKDITVWNERVLLWEVIFMALESVLYLALAAQIDSWSANPRAVSVWRNIVSVVTCRCFCGSSGDDGHHTAAVPDDDDVIAEEQRVLSGGANDDLIVISQLSKVYDNGKVAVNNISLGIPPGQCFGLLGINGAGKTTTMGMLTAEFPPTSGDATLAGFSVTNEPEKTRRRTGYCPQFDAHFSNLTGREHVELYASIKGVPLDDVKEASAHKLAEVGLSELDSDRLSAGYSGGMKRRLSLACATIGQPQIVFLDECSTGVDPVARREIWQMISDMVTGGSMAPEERTSVILTTHSMEECEALCPNIAIMANGKLRCLGSAQHLKSKFGQGYQVEMKVRIVDKQDEDFIQNRSRLSMVAGLAGAPADNNTSEDPENAAGENVGTFLDSDQTQRALAELSGDDYLNSIVSESNPIGYTVYKESNSPTGVNLDVLTSFATTEIRMRKLHEFVVGTYSGSVLRERQDTKMRYEVPSKDTRIGKVFGEIERNKERLLVSEYGVSQTSLEQVFNSHASEAEKLKHGTTD